MLISLTDTLNQNNAMKATFHFYFSPGSLWNGSVVQIYESVGLALLGEELSWEAVCGTTAESFPLPALLEINYTDCFPPHLSFCLGKW